MLAAESGLFVWAGEICAKYYVNELDNFRHGGLLQRTDRLKAEFDARLYIPSMRGAAEEDSLLDFWWAARACAVLVRVSAAAIKYETV